MRRSKPFFSYYGSKYLGAKRYKHPQHHTVIEPFAGSACYATYWSPNKVKLYDKYDKICDVWDFLIKCSIQDIKDLPDYFETREEYEALSDRDKTLIAYWIGYAKMSPPNFPSPWYFEEKKTAHRKASCWGPAVKRRLIRQKPILENWTIDRLSYDEIPDQEAHWFIDPPYQGLPGRKYKENKIDFKHLGDWCKSRDGFVQVCENSGADWLPFRHLYSVRTASSKDYKKVSKEVVYEQSNL